MTCAAGDVFKFPLFNSGEDDDQFRSTICACNRIGSCELVVRRLQFVRYQDEDGSIWMALDVDGPPVLPPYWRKFAVYPESHGSMFTVREKERWPVAGLFHCHRFGDSLTGICAEATDVRTSPASTLIQDCDMGCPH